MSTAKKASLFTCFGAVLLIIGTAIGGGLIALPVVTSSTGFTASSGALLITWFLMTVGAWLILEINIQFPVGTHFIKTAHHTLGKTGMLITLFLYLLLMYSLLSAYFSAGMDLVQGLASFEQITLSHPIALLIFAAIFCTIVIVGIRSVDFVNRGIMILKILTFIALVIIAGRFVDLHRLLQIGTFPTPKVTMAMITAFGFSPLIPTIRRLVPDDTQLRKVLLFGSLTPLIFYLAWECIIFGVIPANGPLGLKHLAILPNPIQHLMVSLTVLTHDEYAKVASRLFTSICVMTAFLAVGLSLSDCIKDTLDHYKPHKFGAKSVYALTFLPPLVIILFFPAVFIFCIGFAGIVCVLLLMGMPAAMGLSVFKAPATRKLIWLYLAVSFVLLVIAFMAY